MKQVIRQIFSRLNMNASRGVLTNINDATSIQEVQVKGFAGEKFDKVQRFQQFGFSSVPEDGDVIILCPQGLRDRAIVICVQDTKHRPKRLKPGDSVMYDAHKNIIKLDENGISVTTEKNITVNAAKNIIINATETNIQSNISIQGNVKITGSLTAGNNVDLNGSVKINGQTQVGN